MNVVHVSHSMRWLLMVLVALGALTTTGCALAPPARVNLDVLHDELFLPVPAVSTSAVFELSPAMKAYADTELAALARMKDPRRALLDALYQKGRLRLDYESSFTRTASQATGLMSRPSAVSPSLCASPIVVPLPMNGSKTLTPAKSWRR